MRVIKTLVCLTVSVLAPIRARAQSTTDQSIEQGIKAYEAYHMSDVDSVNLQNGNLTVKIPLFSLPQRGGQRVSYSLIYNAKQLKPKTVCIGATNDECTDYMMMNADVNGYLGFTLQGDYPAALGVGTEYSKSQYTTCIPAGLGLGCQPGLSTYTVHTVTFASRSIADSTGAKHPLALVSSGLWRAADGSGYQVRSLDSQGDMQSIYPDGTTGVSGAGVTSACTATDANGNTLCSQDTIGRPYLFKFYPNAQPQPGDTTGCTGSLATTATSTIAVPSVNGGTAMYKACYAKISVVAAYNIDEGTQGDSVDITVMQSLVLPDGTAWGFTYDNGTGNLNKLTFPTGASTSYVWNSSLGSPCAKVADVNGAIASRTVDANDGKGPQQWNYVWSSSGGYDWSVTVTDPLRNDTVTHFLTVNPNPGCSYFPQTVTSYQGPANNNQVLKTVTTQYTSPAAAPDYMGVVGVYPTSITTTEGSVTSQVQMDYDSGFTAYSENVTSGGSQSPFALPYGKVMTKREYDFGANGQPGPLLRTTNTQYLAFNNSAYLNANFMNLVSSQTITDGNGVQRAQTTYGYDETSTVASGISTQHTTPPWAPLLGNRTSERHWLSGSAPVTTPNCTPNLQSNALVTTKTYFDTGELQSVTDPCGHSTSFLYDPVYAGAYPTSATNAVGTTRKQYDLNTGQVTASYDLNNQLTSYTYNDPLARITDVTTPDTFNGTHGNAHFTYLSPTSATVAEKISDSITKSTTLSLDGLGRLTTAALTTDPVGPVYVTHGYDALGHETTTSNPTRCSPGSTCNEATAGITQHVFDALGRQTQLVPPDGTTSSNYVGFSYSGNSVVTTDQAGVSSQRNTDALGRMTSAYETNMRWLTNYTYDILGNLLCVEQQGNASGTGCAADPSNDSTSPWRVRRFTYDSLGHLLTDNNPEAGQLSYTYDSDGKVITKTDGRGITTTYNYDNVDRLTGKTYSNGDPTVTYTYDAHSPTNFGIGRRTGMTDASGSTTWTYDAAGHETSETRSIGNVSKTITTYYFLNGTTAQITYPSGDVVTYTPQSAGQISGVADTAGNTFASNLVYNPSGILNTGLFGSAITLTNGYNSRLQPSLLQASTPSATLMSLGYDFGFGVNNNGNLNHLTNYKDTTRNLTFTFDKVNRLTSAHGDQTSPPTHASGSVQIFGIILAKCSSSPAGCDSGTVWVTVGSVTKSTTYGQGDRSQSVISRLATAFNTDSQSPVNGAFQAPASLVLTSNGTGSGTNYAVSAGSQSDNPDTTNPVFTATAPSSGYLSGGADPTLASGQLNEAYTIDPWGNMLPSGTFGMPPNINPNAAFGVNNRIAAFSYDAAGNLLSDGNAGFCGTSNTEYGWNAENQLTCYGSYSYTYNGDGQRVAKSSGTLYWGAGPLAESDLSGNITAEYIFLNGKRIARRDLPSGTVHYFLADNLGSTTLVTDATGNIQNESDLYPFGPEHVVTQSLTNQNYKYTGKERDAESGLDDFGARYFASGFGRFMSPDWGASPIPYATLTDPQTLNLYAYMRNNPLTGADLDGHAGSDCGSWYCDASEEGGHVDGRISPINQTSARDDLDAEAARIADQQDGVAKAQQQVSQAGQDFIKGYESLSLTVYDASKGKVKGGDWTIGYGHKTTKDAGAITLPEAEALFQGDVARMASHVSADLNVPVSQNQFDALVSLRFNAGANAITPPVSDLNRTGHATMGDFTNHYITGGGVPMRGLELRRAAEWKIFSEGVYDASH